MLFLDGMQPTGPRRWIGRTLWLVFILALLASLVVAGSVVTRLLPGAKRPQHDEFLFLYVWELNSRVGGSRKDASPVDWLHMLWGEAMHPFEPEKKRLYVRHARERPDPMQEIVLVYQLEGLMSRVMREQFNFTELPREWQLPIAPVRLDSKANFRYRLPFGREDAEQEYGPSSLRLATGTLLLLSRTESGTVTLTWQDEPIVLAPGEGWANAWLYTSSSSRRLTHDTDASHWQKALLTGLQNGEEVSILRVFNFGWWPHDRVVVHR